MKKKVLAAVVLVGLGGAAYAVLRAPERSTCMRVANLCGLKNGTGEELDECIDNLKQFRKVAGVEAADKGVACVDGATNCSEALGCMAGAGFKGFQNAIKDFFKGFGNAAK